MSELAHVTDLLSLDREVAHGAASLSRWRAELARDPEGAAELHRSRRCGG